MMVIIIDDIAYHCYMVNYYGHNDHFLPMLSGSSLMLDAGESPRTLEDTDRISMSVFSTLKMTLLPKHNQSTWDLVINKDANHPLVITSYHQFT